MLFFVNKPEEGILDRIALIGGDEDKALLLVGDAVSFGTPFWEDRLEDLGVEDVYVNRSSLEARSIELGDGCEVVDYDDIADLLLGGDEKIVSL